ncbi:MAG: hypothetical protein ACRD2W_05805 [Acidimicrobiales bacterium]
MTFVSFVIDVHRALSQAHVAHAFGGALALGFIAEPRGTVDVDVNVFTPIVELSAVLETLSTMSLEPELRSEQWVPVAGIRLRGGTGTYPVDLFPSVDERYAEIAGRCVAHPFGLDKVTLPFLSAEDLALFKLSFGRDKDWVDLRAIASARPDLDADYVERQLVGLRGPSMYPRLARLRRLLREG